MQSLDCNELTCARLVGVPEPPPEYIPALQWAKAHGWLNDYVSLRGGMCTSLRSIPILLTVFADVLPVPVQQPTPPETPSEDPPPEPQLAAEFVNPERKTNIVPPSHHPMPQLPVASPGIDLSPEQLQVLHQVQAGGNVFFTGSAGTGKSVLLREIVKWYRAQGKQLDVTASTGIASVNIGGSTLHSWAGVGLGKELAEVLVMRILGKEKYQRRKRKENRRMQGLPPDPQDDGGSDSDCQPRVAQKWRTCDALIIDESKLPLLLLGE